MILEALLLAAATPAEEARWKAEAARVQIVRDDWGIAHVSGATDADAVFGAIYAQAEDDFNRIETNYLVSLGRLAEADGEAAIWQDLRQRLFLDPEQLKRQHDRAPDWLKRLMAAWADGLNFYLATHPQTKPRVLDRFEPWMALSFTEGSIGGDIEQANLAKLRAFYDKPGTQVAADDSALRFVEPKGSNGIAIAPSRTKDGHALLLINPHTSFYFRSELQMTSGEGLNAYGASTWGQFFIYQGFNDAAGWMHTTSGLDSVDEFAEKIVRTGPRIAYRYGKATRPVRSVPVTLRYKAADGTLASRTFTTWHTHHGPIVRAEGDRWVAMALMNKPIPALEQSFLRTKARDLTGFLQVAERRANSSNATLFADSKGEIAYLHPQFAPKRDNRFDYRGLVDGSDPATDWQGEHALSELPSVLNPRDGWAMNVNNWPWTAAGRDSPKQDAFPRYMDAAGENPRGIHAVTLLDAAKGLDIAGLRDLAYDPWLPAFDTLLPPLIAAHAALDRSDPLRERLEDPVALLGRWDRRWAADSAATSLAVFWGEALWARVAPRARSRGKSPYAEMAGASDAERLAALDEAVARLSADFGRWRVPWGEINRFQRNDGAIVQRFDDARPSTPVVFTSAQWGSLASFGARRYPGTKRYYGTNGNSFVAIVEFGPKVRARAVSAGGESGDPASPHFRDQIGRYAKGDLRPVYFDADALKGHIARTYRPGDPG